MRVIRCARQRFLVRLVPAVVPKGGEIVPNVLVRFDRGSRQAAQCCDRLLTYPHIAQKERNEGGGDSVGILKFRRHRIINREKEIASGLVSSTAKAAINDQ